MITFVYSVRDEVAQRFGPIVQDINDDTARRNFRASMSHLSDESRTFDASDYALYRVGSFDDILGDFRPETSPTLIERGARNEVQ